MKKTNFPIFTTILLLFIFYVSLTRAQQVAPRIEVLQAQLATMEAYNDRLLATVYWSLGGIVAVVILVAGFGWFTNFRLYERDKNMLRQELKSILDTEVAKVFRDLQKDLKENLDESLRISLEEFQRDISKMRMVQLKAEVDGWLEREIPIPTNALRAWLEFLAEAQRLKWSFKISEALDGIRAILNAKSVGADTELATRFNQALDQLPENFRGEIEDLKEMMRKARQ